MEGEVFEVDVGCVELEGNCGVGDAVVCGIVLIDFWGEGVEVEEGGEDVE